MRQLTAASSATTDNDHNVFSSTAAAAADDDDDYDDRVGHTLKIAKRGARLVDEKYPFSNGILDRWCGLGEEMIQFTVWCKTETESPV